VTCRLKADTFATLYRRALSDIFDRTQFESSPRGFKIKEVTNATLELTDPTSNTFISECRPYNKKYLAGELIWYLSGRNDLAFISKFSKFWNRIANDDGTLNSAYGYLIFKVPNDAGVTQFSWALNSLREDRDSRQAVIRFNDSIHSYPKVKDFPCTMFMQFMIRDDRLNAYVTMRSNDIHFGLTYDLPFFCILQQYMLAHLKLVYPELELGTMYHNAMSLHAYEKDFEILTQMMDEGLQPDGMPVLTSPFLTFGKAGLPDVKDEFTTWLRKNAEEVLLEG
jgi:thymidylate synthase